MHRRPHAHALMFMGNADIIAWIRGGHVMLGMPIMADMAFICEAI